MLKVIPIEYTEDGYIKHVIEDGARYHVISWGLKFPGVAFRKCSEPKCEINKPTVYRRIDPNASWALPK